MYHRVCVMIRQTCQPQIVWGALHSCLFVPSLRSSAIYLSVSAELAPGQPASVLVIWLWQRSVLHNSSAVAAHSHRTVCSPLFWSTLLLLLPPLLLLLPVKSRKQRHERQTLCNFGAYVIDRSCHWQKLCCDKLIAYWSQALQVIPSGLHLCTALYKSNLTWLKCEYMPQWATVFFL